MVGRRQGKARRDAQASPAHVTGEILGVEVIRRIITRQGTSRCTGITCACNRGRH